MSSNKIRTHNGHIELSSFLASFTVNRHNVHISQLWKIIDNFIRARHKIKILWMKPKGIISPPLPPREMFSYLTHHRNRFRTNQRNAWRSMVEWRTRHSWWTRMLHIQDKITPGAQRPRTSWEPDNHKLEYRRDEHPTYPECGYHLHCLTSFHVLNQ